MKIINGRVGWASPETVRRLKSKPQEFPPQNFVPPKLDVTVSPAPVTCHSLLATEHSKYSHFYKNRNKCILSNAASKFMTQNRNDKSF